MALDLETVAGYVKDVRGILLDKTRPYRYTDTALLVALNLALLEGRRLRPDLFICGYGLEVPHYEVISGEEVPIEGQFRLAFVYGVVAQVLLRDEEDVQDARANSFRSMFEDMLLGVRRHPVQGGTPTPASVKGGQ